MSASTSTTDSSSTANLSGTVTDATTGETLSGITVTLFDSNNKKTSANTDSSGQYSIQGLTAGEYDIEVEGDEYDATNADDVQLNAGDNVRNFQMGTSDDLETSKGSEADVLDGDDDTWESEDGAGSGF